MCTRKNEIPIQLIKNNPLSWKMPDQLTKYIEHGKTPRLLIKCGKCYECKAERSRNWIFKIWLEAKEHEEQCFITLTYKNTKTQKGKQLNKKHLQDFIKRLRKHTNAKIKYFGAGEYGDKKGRAHYHLIVLGYIPKDLIFWGYSKKGSELFRSKEMDKLWGHGLTTIQAFHKDEVSYLSLYIDNNSYIHKTINRKENEDFKRKKWELYEKHKIATIINGVLVKKRNIKDLTKQEYQEYKKDYNDLAKTRTYKKTPEFNVWSKNMGFFTYIKNKYYKYDLILDGYKIEIPKEYLRKVIENQNKYSKEVIEYTIYELLERRKHAEENYIDPRTDIEELKLERIKERKQIDLNTDRIKLYKIHESDF